MFKRFESEILMNQTGAKGIFGESEAFTASASYIIQNHK